MNAIKDTLAMAVIVIAAIYTMIGAGFGLAWPLWLWVLS